MTDAPYRKPQFNIYSTMLVIAFVALLIGSVFAYLETMDYKTDKTKGAPPVSMAAPGDGTFGVVENCRYKNKLVNLYQEDRHSCLSLADRQGKQDRQGRQECLSS